MTAIIVNLELWFVYDDEQKYSDIIDKTYQLALQDITKQLTATSDTVIGLLLCDGFLYKNNDEFYNLLGKLQLDCKNKGIKNFIIIAGIVEDYQHELDKRNLNWKILCWDFSVNGIYQSYKNRLSVLPQWNFNSDKFLFLGGQPARKNRITLLSKFYDKNLLDKSIWSFFIPDKEQDKEWCRNELSHYTDIQYKKFLQDCNRSVDDLYETAKTYAGYTGKQWLDSDILKNEFLNDPNFIDPSVFQSTAFSVVSEGHVHPPGNDYRFLTEKTWRTVLNCHPFILACVPQRMDFIKQKGLKTFESYMSNPQYAYIEDYNDRLDTVVTNTENFLKNISQYKDAISNDIYYNYNRFFQIVKENQAVINHLKEKFSISDDVIAYWFEQKSFVHLFRIPK